VIPESRTVSVDQSTRRVAKRSDTKASDSQGRTIHLSAIEPRHLQPPRRKCVGFNDLWTIQRSNRAVNTPAHRGTFTFRQRSVPPLTDLPGLRWRARAALAQTLPMPTFAYGNHLDGDRGTSRRSPRAQRATLLRLPARAIDISSASPHSCPRRPRRPQRLSTTADASDQSNFTLDRRRRSNPSKRPPRPFSTVLRVTPTREGIPAHHGRTVRAPTPARGSAADITLVNTYPAPNDFHGFALARYRQRAAETARQRLSHYPQMASPRTGNCADQPSSARRSETHQAQ
jgi:hypothetical protein